VLGVRTIALAPFFHAERRNHVPKTLLAVDDSATMRKALEITFGSEDFRVVTADTSASALALLREEPAAVVIDTALGSEDGYALARAVRSRDARVAVVALASRYSPYDPARGREAGFDDFADKPFDTQSLLDKVKKAIIAREGARPAAPAPVAAPPPPAQAPAPAFGSRAPAVPSPAAPSVVAKPQWPAQRTHTLTFEGGVPAAPPPPGFAAAPPMSHVPQPTMQRGPAPTGLPIVSPHPAPVAPTAPVAPQERARAVASAHMAPTAPPAAEVVAAAANGRLAGKLGELGLSPQQVEAVLALSREVVERVVWEVVPQLAETMIKEEITRLTKEG
jgi:CheY-like chemotaxis protein